MEFHHLHCGRFSLNDYDRHLARFLRGQGYETVLSGVQHEAADTGTIGYDRVLLDTWGKNIHVTATKDRDLQAAGLACDYLRGRGEAAKPFFLSLGLFSTHRPFPEAEDGDGNEPVQPPFTAYDCRETREDMAGYIRSAKIADACIGKVLDTVRQLNLQDDTVILFTTDHGIAFPNMKCNLYDTGTGVALMLAYPGNPTAGSETDALVSHIDLFPTLCELCDLPKPEWLRGVSLLPVLKGETETVNDRIFSEVTYHASYEPMRCIRTERYKLIRRFDSHLGIVPANIDDGPTKRMLLEGGLMGQTVEREMLFDLRLDPMERENRIGDSAYSGIYKDLCGQLGMWMQETNDPLLQTPLRVPLPEGAFEIPLSQLHP